MRLRDRDRETFWLIGCLEVVSIGLIVAALVLS